MANYYKASGQFSPISFLYFIGASLIVLPILALIYTYLIWYIPFIYINLFITLGFGFAVGLTVNFLVIKLGKVRNHKLAMVFGFFAGLIALYFSWAVWVDLVFNIGESYGTSRIGITTSNIKFFQVVELALHPKELLSIIAEINAVGTWGIGSSTVSGIFLTIIWIIEALIVIVLSILPPLGQSKTPFCELNNNWFKEVELPALEVIRLPGKFIEDIENVNLQSFEDLKTVHTPKVESHSVFTIYSSKKGENYLSVENRKASKNRKGDIDFNKEEFVTYIQLDKEIKEVLLKK